MNIFYKTKTKYQTCKKINKYQTHKKIDVFAGTKKFIFS